MATTFYTGNATLTAPAESDSEAYGTTETLITTPAGKSYMVYGLEVCGGASGGSVKFIKNNGSTDVYTWEISVAAQQVVYFDNKWSLPAGYMFKAAGDSDGIQVSVSALEQG